MTFRLQRLMRFAGRVARRFFDDGCPSLAGSLAFTTLLALVPLVTIALALFTAFPVFEQFTRGLDEFLSRNLLPPAVAETVTGYVQQFAASAAQLTAAGIALLAVSALLLMATVERAFDAIWRVARRRRIGTRVLMYWAVLTLGPLLVGVGLTLTSQFVTASLGVTGEIPGLEALVLDAVAIVLTACAFTFVYYVVPNRPVELAHAAIAGLAAAVAFELMKRGFALYIARFPSYAVVYGAFATVPIFLLWLYLSWVVTLLGAVTAALLPDYGVEAPMQQPSGSAFRAALEVLRALVRAQHLGRAPRTRAIAREARVGREAAHRALDDLAAAGWVARVVGDRWALACDPDNVRVAAIYRRVVFDAARERRCAADTALAALLERAGSSIDQALDAPISSLAEEPAGAAISPPR